MHFIIGDTTLKHSSEASDSTKTISNRSGSQLVSQTTKFQWVSKSGNEPISHSVKHRQSGDRELNIRKSFNRSATGQQRVKSVRQHFNQSTNKLVNKEMSRLVNQPANLDKQISQRIKRHVVNDGRTQTRMRAQTHMHTHIHARTHTRTHVRTHTLSMRRIVHSVPSTYRACLVGKREVETTPQ